MSLDDHNSALELQILIVVEICGLDENVKLVIGEILYPVGDKIGAFFCLFVFFEDPAKAAMLFHKHLYMSGSRDANLKTKCLYLCLIVSLWAARLALGGIMLKRENRPKKNKTKRGRLGVGGEMNESLLMSLCCRDNVNLIIQRAGTSAFAFLTSYDVGALFISFFCSARSVFHVSGCHSPSAASDCFCVLFS